MKSVNRFLFKLAAVAMLVIVALALPSVTFAQGADTPGISSDPFPDGVISIDSLLNAYNVIYGALVIVIGYLAKLFNFKYDLSLSSKQLPIVIAAAGIVLGIAFVMFGFSSVFPLLFSFLGAVGIYDFILKPSGLTVKAKASVAPPPA